MMRCRQCGTSWLARAFDDDPYQRGLMRVGDEATDVSDALVIEHIAPAFTRSQSRKSLLPPPMSGISPARRQAPTGRRLKALGIAFGVLAAFVVFRAPIVAALPELKGLPAEAHLLEFQKVRSETVHLGGVSTLFVEGEIVNRSGGDVALPAIRITLKSPEGDAVSSWLLEPSAQGLGAGRSIGFRSALASPPVGATQVTLNLAEREGTQIGLR